MSGSRASGSTGWWQKINPVVAVMTGVLLLMIVVVLSKGGKQTESIEETREATDTELVYYRMHGTVTLDDVPAGNMEVQFSPYAKTDQDWEEYLALLEEQLVADPPRGYTDAEGEYSGDVLPGRYSVVLIQRDPSGVEGVEGVEWLRLEHTVGEEDALLLDFHMEIVPDEVDEGMLKLRRKRN